METAGLTAAGKGERGRQTPNQKANRKKTDKKTEVKRDQEATERQKKKTIVDK